MHAHSSIRVVTAFHFLLTPQCCEIPVRNSISTVTPLLPSPWLGLEVRWAWISVKGIKESHCSPFFKEPSQEGCISQGLIFTKMVLVWSFKKWIGMSSYYILPWLLVVKQKTEYHAKTCNLKMFRICLKNNYPKNWKRPTIWMSNNDQWVLTWKWFCVLALFDENLKTSIFKMVRKKLPVHWRLVK